MTGLEFRVAGAGDRLGLKGPRAAEWLAAQGVALPPAANTWIDAAADAGGAQLLVARLGNSEFFLEDRFPSATLRDIADALHAMPPGVYPVLREDAAFVLSGDGARDVLAEVCNVNFAALDQAASPIVMTLMMGIAVLVVPGGGVEPHYRIWCDPAFGWYLETMLGKIVGECGGGHGGVRA